MKKNIVNTIAFNALIAALYFVLSLPFGELNYGAINFRISEILILLSLYNKRFVPGLVLGCFLVNTMSDLPLDMLIGTLQTLLACLILRVFSSSNTKFYLLKQQLAVFLCALSCGIIIGAELSFAYESMFVYHFFTITLSELIILEIGYWICYFLSKNRVFKKYF